MPRGVLLSIHDVPEKPSERCYHTLREAIEVILAVSRASGADFGLVSMRPEDTVQDSPVS